MNLENSLRCVEKSSTLNHGTGDHRTKKLLHSCYDFRTIVKANHSTDFSCKSQSMLSKSTRFFCMDLQQLQIRTMLYVLCIICQSQFAFGVMISHVGLRLRFENEHLLISLQRLEKNLRYKLHIAIKQNLISKCQLQAQNSLITSSGWSHFRVFSAR